MTEMFTKIGQVITGIVTQMGTVTTALLANDLFVLGFGILIFTIIVGIVVGLVKRGRGKK